MLFLLLSNLITSSILFTGVGKGFTKKTGAQLAWEEGGALPCPFLKIDPAGFFFNVLQMKYVSKCPYFKKSPLP